MLINSHLTIQNKAKYRVGKQNRTKKSKAKQCKASKLNPKKFCSINPETFKTLNFCFFSSAIANCLREQELVSNYQANNLGEIIQFMCQFLFIPSNLFMNLI